jgi:hypothetical protein
MRTRPSTLTSSGLRKQIEQASRPLWSNTAAVAPQKWQGWAIAAGVAVVILAVLSFLPPVSERVADFRPSGRTHCRAALRKCRQRFGERSGIGWVDGQSRQPPDQSRSGERSLWVLPTSEVRRLKIADAASALRELGATVVVQGSLQRDGQAIRMTVNLVNTTNLRQIGSVTFEDRAGDFSSLEDEAVARVAKLMRIEVTPEMLRATGGAVNAGAYELYLKALGYTQRYDKAGNLDLAIAALDSAVKADPHFALGFRAARRSLPPEIPARQRSRVDR